MKHRHWLDFTEYVMLFGSGVGTVASVASQQVLYTAAPLSFLMLLNLVNRQRLQKRLDQELAPTVAYLDQRLSEEVDTIQQQVEQLPNLSMFVELKTATMHNQGSLSHLATRLNQLQKEVTQQTAPLREHDLAAIHQEVEQLQTRSSSLEGSFKEVSAALNRVATSARVEALEDASVKLSTDFVGLRTEITQLQTSLQTLVDEQRLLSPRTLQDQIDHLNRRLSNLPQPFDASLLKKDIESLLSVVTDLVPRRELARVLAEFEKLHHHQQSLDQSLTVVRLASSVFRKQLDSLSVRLKAKEESVNWLTGDVTHQINSLQQQLELVQQATQTLEQEHHILLTHLEVLQRSAADLPPAETTTLEHQLNALTTRVEWAESSLGLLQNQVDATRHPEPAVISAVQELPSDLEVSWETLGDFTQELKALEQTLQPAPSDVTVLAAAPLEIPPSAMTQTEHLAPAADPTPPIEPLPLTEAAPASSDSELVFALQPEPYPSGDTEETLIRSRSMLEEALDRTQERIIIVCPYPTPDTIDDRLMQRFEDVLQRGVQIDVGWGHLADVNKIRLPRCLHNPAIDATEKGFLHTMLRRLSQLKQRYSDQFHFKILGTHENFLVCDRAFAIVGVHPVPTASDLFPTVSVGLRSRDPDVVQSLIDRFDAPDPDPHNPIAYFNRGTTRHDLGDKPGAVSDYTQVLRVSPQDDVAYNNRGLARYELGDRAGAIMDFNNSLQLNPNNPIAYFNRGCARADLGDKLGSISDYSQAIQQQPDFAVAYFCRGIARTRMGNRAGAIEDYTDAIRLNPDDAMSYFYRGVAYFRRGDKQKAAIDLRQAETLFSVQKDQANRHRVRDAIKDLEEALSEANTSQAPQKFWTL